MTTARKSLVGVLAFLLMAGSAFADQQHIVSPPQIAATVADRVAAQDADRAAVRDALARPDVRGVAATMGVDARRLDAAVDLLSGADLEQAAATARQVNDQMVGGASTIVISTTTIIIILLVVILLIVIAK